MRIQTFREATQGFNPQYQCYWENEAHAVAISDFDFDKQTNVLYLLPYHDHPLQFKALEVIANALSANVKIQLKTKSGKKLDMSRKMMNIAFEKQASSEPWQTRTTTRRPHSFCSTPGTNSPG